MSLALRRSAIIYIYIYIYIHVYIYVCNASAHALRRIIIIINTCIYMRAMGRHGFPGGMQLPLVAMVLREASALMRISSIICNQWRSTVTLCIHIVIFL